MIKSLSDLGSVKNPARKQLIPVAFTFATMLSLYLLSQFVEPGIVTSAISAPALAVVIITALARVNDIAIKLTGIRWAARRFGLVMTGAASAGLLLNGDHPTWHETMLHVGFAVTWFTTPGMPPWWRYIGGKDAAPAETH